ncbi:MAG: hypothetical protein E7672_06815 [Ruminococcaceae bacterium]|nr:hypothetical protein [Oscillospiraceae bacterium]
MRKRSNLTRLAVIFGLYILIIAVYIGRLLYLQVSGQDYYTMSTPVKEYSRYETIHAQRGEIFDRNGKPLVTNDYSYSILLDYATRPSSQAEINEMILEIEAIAARTKETSKLVTPRSSISVTVGMNGLTFEKSDGFENTARGKRYAKIVGGLGLSDNPTTDEEARALMYRYGILSREWNPREEKYEYYYNYTYTVAAHLFSIRLDMELSEFSAVQPYKLAEDVSLAVITGVEERFSRGFIIKADASRIYNYPGYASHILGRIGPIQSNVEYYTSQGYSLNATVGLEGVELAFENYLRGVDGTLKIIEDGYGNIVRTEIVKEPIAGKDVFLTIDIDMQIVAEKALAENIFKIREEGQASGKPLSGEDAAAGALVAQDPDTGEVLAICSYPTYNLATYGKDFNKLLNDEYSPLLNRALNGRYAPGSTFKVGVALAALTEGTITADTVIDTLGEYRYYESANFTPRCWIYLLTDGKAWHGEIKVVEAIQESCNYFFYEVGRLLTIEKMNEYAHHLGLGEKTGIELPEETGILAGPDYRNDNGLDKWSPGDTLQAAIGQSDNVFTPIQIGTYLSTILNSGKRYATHLLYAVREYGTGEIIHKSTPKVVDSFDISEENLEIVMEGMKGVMDNGSAASVFRGYDISVGGKTGTAQVFSNKSDNGIMTAFAPFEDPQIVVTCVIEQGSGGTDVGYAIRDVFDYYFRDWDPDADDDTNDTTDEN